MQAGGWGQVANADGFRIMVYDVPSATAWNPGEIPFFVSVRGDDADQLTRYWEKLSTGSTIVQPLGPAGFSPLYGMIKDPFGVHSDVSRASPWLRQWALPGVAQRGIVCLALVGFLHFLAQRPPACSVVAACAQSRVEG